MENVNVYLSSNDIRENMESLSIWIEDLYRRGIPLTQITYDLEDNCVRLYFDKGCTIESDNESNTETR